MANGKREDWIKLGRMWFYEAESVSLLDPEKDKAEEQKCVVVFKGYSRSIRGNLEE